MTINFAECGVPACFRTRDQTLNTFDVLELFRQSLGDNMLARKAGRTEHLFNPSHDLLIAFLPPFGNVALIRKTAC